MMSLQQSSTSTNAIRAFVALEIPASIQQILAGVMKRLKARLTDSPVRWVAAQKIHLTLKFLGEVSPANLDALKAILSAEAAHQAAFTFTIGGLGAFPSARRPEVVWCGIQSPPELAQLYKAIDAQAHRLGYPLETRPFSPHVTLGRVQRGIDPVSLAQISQALAQEQMATTSAITADRLTLFKSDLRPDGAVYTALLVAPLGKSRAETTTAG